MRALIVGDLHGEVPDIPEKEFDLVLCVGDFCGDSDEMRSAMFESMETGEEWYEILGEENAKQMVEESIRKGKEVLDILNGMDVPVLVVPGNWDWTGENSDWSFLKQKGYPSMLEGFENVENLNFSRKEINEWRFVGYGPFSGPEIPEKGEVDQEEMKEIRNDYERKRERLAEMMKEEKTILLSHNVPNSTSLDMIRDEESPEYGNHFGSIIVRELIEEFSPEYSIAGHMHEGEGTERIDGTLCLNTGLGNLWALDTKKEVLEKL